jgi:hypothetical protein
VIGACVIVVYSAALAGLIVAISGGGSDSKQVKTVVERAPKARPLSALEKQLRTMVIRAPLYQHEAGDIGLFRAPEPTKVVCNAGDCTVDYYVAVPGRGRILEQQAYMVKAIFQGLPVTKLKLGVLRGQPTGPNASRESEEETSPGLPLLTTNCATTETVSTAWRSAKNPYTVLQLLCGTKDANLEATFYGKGQPARKPAQAGPKDK